MKKLLLSLAALLVLALPSVALADTFTFQPTPADMYDLDHHSIYTWRIDSPNLNGKVITGATLKITNIRNWDSNPNMLFIHLLDSARNAGVAAMLDANPNQAPVTDIVDDFVNPRYHNGTNALGQSVPWLLDPGTGDTFLTSQSFTTTPTNFVYNFTAAQLQALFSYMAGGNFALGFDPDCHFFNDGISLTITTANAPVPEPATMTLLGTGLAGLYYRRRRQQKARSASSSSNS